ISLPLKFLREFIFNDNKFVSLYDISPEIRALLGNKPNMDRPNTDLPLPVSPTRPNTLPIFILREILSTAFTFPSFVENSTFKF
ncbi:MAG: hypothetical protein E7A48_08960, partial [Lactobacillus paragasseri]|nr:hypothetical protein [Lactobacillus paragasseri]